MKYSIKNSLLVAGAMLTFASVSAQQCLLSSPTEHFSTIIANDCNRRVAPYSATHAPMVRADKGGVHGRKVVTPVGTSAPAAYCTLLDAPDGSTWYATCDYQYDDFGSITHFSTTIYDASFNIVGTIDDDVALDPAFDETRVVDVQIHPQITSKFFNIDQNYELMVFVITNTAQYVNREKTVIYQIGASEPLMTFDGNCISTLNASTDSWSETFYLTFMTESIEEGYDFHIYSKAGYGEGPEEIGKLNIPALHMSGENTIPFLAVMHDKTPYFFINYLEKTFFEDPYDFENENISPDNHFIIDMYAYTGGYNREFVKKGSTSIACDNPASMADPFKQYYLGQFMFDDDITFGVYNDDPSSPCFVITEANYVTGTDSYTYNFVVYNAAGEKLNTIIENTGMGIFMQDLPGQQPQVLFISEDVANETYTFNFIDYITCTNVLSIGQFIDGYALSASVDRVANGDSYLYVSSPAMADVDADGNVIHNIVYFTADGELDHVDGVKLGTDVAFAQVWLNGRFVNPYTYDTDDAMEYAFLIKRYANAGQSQTFEELAIIDSEGNVQFRLRPDNERGKLALVDFVTNPTDSKMWVLWEKDWIYTTDLYNLPLECFTAGGDGSADNPYIVETIADIQQIGQHPNDYYVLANDIDATNFTFYTIPSFGGCLDGNGYTISNLTVSGNGLFDGVYEGAVIKDLKFANATITEGEGYSASLLAGGVILSTIENVHVDGLRCKLGANLTCPIGGLVNTMAVSSSMRGCSVANADIDAPGAEIGGLVYSTATTTKIEACSFEGRINGNSTIGGIAAHTISEADVITNCRVNADITGRYLIGGIVGDASRGQVSHCYAEGSIRATGPYAWGRGPQTGGIIGALEAGWSQFGSTTAEPIVFGNVANFSTFSVASITGSQVQSFHRIIGWSAAEESAEDDASQILNELALADNYATAPLRYGIADVKGVNGASIELESLNQDFFKSIGFAYGNTIDEPWNVEALLLPCLWYQNAAGSGIGQIVTTPTSSQIIFDGASVKAEGRLIELYTTAGIKVATSRNRMETTKLAGGIYIAVATDSAGHSSAIKISIK